MSFPAMPHAMANFLSLIADSAARSLALGCIAGIALSIWRVKSVWLRLHVWRAVLCVALLMPLLGAFLPKISLKVPTEVAKRFEKIYTASQAGSAVATDEAQSLQSADFAINPQASSVRSFNNLGTEKGPVANSGPAAVSSHVANSQTSVNKSSALTRTFVWLKLLLRATGWSAIVAATYFVVTLSLLLRFGLGLVFSLKLRRSATAIRDQEALELVSKNARTMETKRSPRLAESEFLSVPVTVGAVRTAILLPAGWRDWEEGELDAVIAHEMSHVARRDALVDCLALLHRSIFWFSPLSWHLVSCLRDLAEEASDEAALAAGADRTRYAETLLGFFSDLEAVPGRVWWQGVAMAKTGQAEKRLDRILEWKGSVAMQLKKSAVVLVVMTAVPVVYLAAALRPGAYRFHSTDYHDVQEQTPTPPPAPAAPRPTPTAIAVAALPSVSPLPTLPTVVAVAPLVSGEPVVTLAPMRVVTPVRVVALAPLVRMGQSSHSDSTVFVRGSDGDGQQFVISSGKMYVSVSGDSESSGMDQPSEFVEFLQEKIPGDFIWFRHDGKSYVIRDQATVKRAADFFSQLHAIEQKQDELGKQQEALGEQQEALGKEQEGIRVEIPDMTEDLHKLEAELKALGKTGSEEDLGRIQEKIGDLQSKLGDLQSKAGEAQGKLGEKQGALGEKQGKLGEQQGELGRQEEHIFRDASRQMKGLIDGALAHGLAKPE
jgi:beta-lactamase regulating signal transducer with metallopeptidase domain